MCEILYKGFHKDENGTEKIFVDDKWIKGEWVYGYYIRYGWTNQEKDYIVPLYASDLYAKEVIPETVGQYTGLTDKNGKKIFKGDILEFSDRLVVVFWHVHLGCWDSNFLKFTNKENGKDDMSSLNWSYKSKVIGSIYDNPELLEGESK